ncbi:hypothetical protein LPJ56_005866, partial [Coemansia sp. RSA 2599]
MEPANSLQITFEGLTYTVKVTAKTQASENGNGGPITGVKGMLKKPFSKTKYVDKVILNQMNGTFRPGRLTAILGPSGSGKTTLLNLLAGQISSGVTSGNIWVNGRPTSGAGMRRLAGFVNQEDVILSTQTVEEAIEMSIVLRPPPLSSGMSQPPLQLPVDGIEMDDDCQHVTLDSNAPGPDTEAAQQDKGGGDVSASEKHPMPATMHQVHNAKASSSSSSSSSSSKKSESLSAADSMHSQPAR